MDPETGYLNINPEQGSTSNNGGGAWACMMDGGVAAPAPVRRLRAQAHAPALTEGVEVPTWDPEKEARRHARREDQALRWESSQGVALPSGPTTQDAQRQGRRMVENAPDATSFSFRYQAPDPASQAPIAPREDAPWQKANPEEGERVGRRLVDGVIPTASRITWEGYGRNDPNAAMAEPLGMAREADNDM